MTEGGGGTYMIMVVAVSKKGAVTFSSLIGTLGEGLPPWVREKARHAVFERRCAKRATVRRASPKDKKQPKGWFLQFPPVCLRER